LTTSVFQYKDKVIVSDFIDIGDNVYLEFDISYHLISIIGDLEN